MTVDDLQKLSRQELKTMLRDDLLNLNERENVRTAYRLAFRRTFLKFVADWAEESQGRARTIVTDCGNQPGLPASEDHRKCRNQNEIKAVQELRRLTGLGLMKCKVALKENDWDIKKAFDTLIKEWRDDSRYKW